MKLKAMVFGREGLRQRMTVVLGEGGVEVVGAADVAQAMAAVESGGVNLAVIDSLAEGFEAVCRWASRLPRISVVVTVGDHWTDWEMLHSLDVDGYLPERAGAAETIARLRAVVRRMGDGGSNHGANAVQWSGDASHSV